ncbi:MAG: hypothetical protein FWE08_04690 [Oscillospiraceae bacterium]|nr:hypothetical protein [Oscillospiraceae bacterium]
MGAWDSSVTGNDTAQDMKSEYQAAFYYNDVETALKKIDDYVRLIGFDESDPREWCDYYYSLADFMWRKGILSDAVMKETLRLIDSGFGLELWEESGRKILEGRKKALQKFRDKITAPQPPKKKISIKLYMKPIFEIGDIITFQLQTADKTYTGEKANVSETDFKEADGKYIVIRKIADKVSYTSVIEPAVRDIWPIFQLYDGIFDELPKPEDVMYLKSAKFILPLFLGGDNPDGIFGCEGSLFYFKKRKHVILGNDQKDIDRLFNKYNIGMKYDTYGASVDVSNDPSRWIEYIFFSINKPWRNADEDFINAISGR